MFPAAPRVPYRRTPRTLATAVLLLLAPAGAAAGQGIVLDIGEAVVLPADLGVPLPIALSSDEPLSALVLHISYNASRLTLADVSLAGGVLDGVDLELADVDFIPGGGEVTIRWTLDSTAPFGSVIATGEDQLLATLIFDIHDFVLAGTETAVEFTTDLSPFVANEVFVDGDEAQATFANGSITTSEENFLLVKNDIVNAGQIDQKYPIFAYNVVAIQGFSIGLTYDAGAIDLTDISIDDTITDNVGADYVAPVIDALQGTAICGVLLDALPPFDDQVIPAAGTVHTIANLVYDVFPAAIKADTPVTFVDGLGLPPIDNVFVAESESIAPNLVSAILSINELDPFIRGDANQSGVFDLADPIFTINVLFVDEPMPSCLKAFDSNDDSNINIADPIYSLDFLFQGGPAPPPPFPEPGFDPTPDNIFCE